MMLKPMAADLHVHTVLSPCAEVEMIPPLIVSRAVRLGLELIAITDHNASLNVEAVIRAAEGSGVHVLPGMELQTREDVHLLCLFDTAAQSLAWQEEVFLRLPPLANREAFFGPQYVVGAAGEWRRTEKRLLAGSASMTLAEAVGGVHRLGGLAIAAHVDRPSFSVLASLGFVPEGLALDALEVTPRFVPAAGFKQWPELKAWPLVVSGDAHRLAEMQNRTVLRIAEPAVREIALALAGEAGRQAVVEWPHPPSLM